MTVADDGDRSFLSIGEVLDLLKDEFPDVTISKIRFLESQGLLDPERTPSGYRKFYDDDIARLRWILTQQKENFLPLKVIKGRLGSGAPEASAPAPEPAAAPAPAAIATAPPPAPSPSPVRAARSAPEEQSARRDAFASGVSGVSMTFDELRSASGLEPAALRELERYALVEGKPVGGQTYYDEDALVVARLAAGFARHGVEARHLKMYKTAAERESGFYEQVIMPLIKQRNPASRRQALDTLAELSQLGGDLRGALLRAALRQYTE
ncbi:MAG TPA: MerR family transcriptional regulator [Acidimicrobiales bacterium]|nr:MerR family transcriptional regulator [Acidimicrobiales bacterium]